MKSGYDKPVVAFLFPFGPGETVEDIVKHIRRAKELGYRQLIVTYQSKSGMKQVPFDDQYFSAVDNLAAACREEEMPFWIPDFTQFPTGSAGCVLEQGEYPELNKLFIDERHIDITGPMEAACIDINRVRNIFFGKALHRFAVKDASSRSDISITAFKLQENPENAAAPFLLEETATSLESYVKDGYLTWDVPEGDWRICLVFTTRETGGRPYYVNLLSRESVALEIKTVHERIYEHLKPEIGKLWYGFFYDEPEVGNDGGADVFDFFMLPGKRSRFMDDVEVYSWSPEMPEEMEKRDPAWRKKLALLFYDGVSDIYKDFRADYMDAASTLVRENYMRQVYEFCRERGIYYFGHSLEDENSHTRLGCGLGHYFRHQYYMDEAGIDVIAGQILPGRDKAVTWYGVSNADGEFYHYGLSKLASSEAHINPRKKGRSVVEVFAAYGQQGLAERKFVLDHILVNGVTRMYLMDEGVYREPVEYERSIVEYCDQVSGVMYTSKPVIKAAVLYHAEAEWREGEKAEKFQKPAAVLARNQISYDIIPADVFSTPEMYDADFAEGLVINGHVYEALVIPGCERLPKAVEGFVRNCRKTGFPVVVTSRAPERFGGLACKNVISCSLSELASELKKRICPDIELESEKKQWFRYMHLDRGEEQFYFIHNEAQRGEADAVVTLSESSEAFVWDIMSGKLFRTKQDRIAGGKIRIPLHFGEYEMKVLYFAGSKGLPEPVYEFVGSTAQEGRWMLRFEDGFVTVSEGLLPPKPEEHTGPGYYGKLIYETSFSTAGRKPAFLDLGMVSDCAEVFLNGVSLGKRCAAPYLYQVKDMHEGENEIRIEVFTSAVNLRRNRMFMGIPTEGITSVPYELVLPMGLRNSVHWLYGTEQIV